MAIFLHFLDQNRSISTGKFSKYFKIFSF